MTNIFEFSFQVSSRAAALGLGYYLQPACNQACSQKPPLTNHLPITDRILGIVVFLWERAGGCTHVGEPLHSDAVAPPSSVPLDATFIRLIHKV